MNRQQVRKKIEKWTLKAFNHKNNKFSDRKHHKSLFMCQEKNQCKSKLRTSLKTDLVEVFGSIKNCLDYLPIFNLLKWTKGQVLIISLNKRYHINQSLDQVLVRHHSQAVAQALKVNTQNIRNKSKDKRSLNLIG